MIKKSFAGFVWLLLASVLLQLAPSEALALTYYWGRHPDKERLVLVFPDKIPPYSVTRTGRTTIEVGLPEDYWDNEPKPEPANFASASLLKRVKILRDGLEIQVKNAAFGYIQFPLNDRGKLVVDVFPDPIGAKWKPSGAAIAPKIPLKEPPAPKKAEEKKKPVVSQPTFKGAVTPKKEEKKPEQAAPESVKPEPAAQPVVNPAVKSAVQPPAPQPSTPAATTKTTNGQPSVSVTGPEEVQPSSSVPFPQIDLPDSEKSSQTEAKSAVAPAPVKIMESAGPQTKGGAKPEPAVKAAVKPEPRPGFGSESKPEKPAGQAISLPEPTQKSSPAEENSSQPAKGPGAGTQAETGVKVPTPPVIELPEEKASAHRSTGQTRQPFYTVPYSYRAPIDKDSTPFHRDSRFEVLSATGRSANTRAAVAEFQAAVFFL